MNPVHQIENLVAILMSSIDLQIHSIRLLGDHYARYELIKHIKTLTEALLDSIQNIEYQFIERVWNDSELVLGQSATLCKSFAMAMNEMPNLKMLQQLSKIATNGHNSITTSLAKGEVEITGQVIDRFTTMKDKIKAVRSRIESL